MPSSNRYQHLARKLQALRTTTDAEEVIALAEEITGPVTWIPVGNRENNHGIIRLGSDPGLALVERITNGIDAVLDMGHLLNPNIPANSPRQGSAKWFHVPSAGLGAMDDSQRRDLGANVSVVLANSGNPKRPSVLVRDRGTGQEPSDFAGTLLSLNENNKVGQPWTMGQYGQGGSVTYGFCESTLIASRRSPDIPNSSSKEIGWTIVKEHYGDPVLQPLSSWRYLADTEGRILTIPAKDWPEFEGGTLIVHTSYDLQGMSGPFTTNLWQFMNAALFDPALPFLLGSERTNDKGNRVITGNRTRLDNAERAKGDIECTHSESVKVTLGAERGRIVINYWVLQRPQGSTSKNDPTEGYVRADSAISITLSGQRQDTERRSWIKEKVKLPFLMKNLIVQIEADGLTPQGKRELFSSTRERATTSDLKQDIYDQLQKTLSVDEDLKRLNNEEKERQLARATQVANDRIRQRLAKFIKTHTNQQSQQGKRGQEKGEDSTRSTNRGGHGTKRNRDDSTLPSVPTYLRFERSAIKIQAGRRTTFWVEIDAKNGYLPQHDDDLEVVWMGDSPGEKVWISGKSKLNGGKSRWFMEAAADAILGKYCLRALLVTPNGVLSDEIEVEVVAAEQAKGGASSGGASPAQGPNILWYGVEDDVGHTINDVGYVMEDQDSTTIFVNKDFVSLERSLRGNLTAEQIETRKERYLLPVACGLWLQEQAVMKADPKPDERYLKEEIVRLAEAVLVTIDPEADLVRDESDD